MSAPESPGMKPILLEEEKMGSLTLWAPEGYEKARQLTPSEKIADERLERILTEKAELREETCWCADCTLKATAWVREVLFDMKKDEKAEPNFRQVTSADYIGPIPGFCFAHISSGPPLLAQAVYFSSPPMEWGLKPRRWFCIFTDGTKQGGSCLSLDPDQMQPTVGLESHVI